MTSRILIYLLHLLLLTLMAVPVLLDASGPWWVDNLLGLQWQWALLAPVAIGIGLLRLPRSSMLLIPIYTILLLANFADLYAPLPDQRQDDPVFSIAQLNLRYDNPHAPEIFADLLAADYDLLVLQEISDQQAGLLQHLRERYRYAVGSQALSDHSPGHVLLSKRPLRKRRIHDLGYADGKVIDVEFFPTEGALPVRVLALHPAAPRDRALWQLRNATLAFIAREVSDSPSATQLVIGDLNVTSWSGIFRQLLRESELKDCGSGLGYQPTWSLISRMAPLRFLASAAIDHCLVGSGLQVRDRLTRIVAGSDHRLVVTQLQLN